MGKSLEGQVQNEHCRENDILLARNLNPLADTELISNVFSNNAALRASPIRIMEALSGQGTVENDGGPMIYPQLLHRITRR
jgi:hypothetical protein